MVMNDQAIVSILPIKPIITLVLEDQEYDSLRPIVKKAGAELGQAHVKLEVILEGEVGDKVVV